jgi:hypothetical protein
MGCDIHCYKEKFVDGRWITADEWQEYDYGDDDKGAEVSWEKRFTDRNYDLFGLLAKGVRRDFDNAFVCREMPFDACQEVRAACDSYGVDGHSHSYLYLHELKAMQAHLQNTTLPVSGMKDREGLAALQASIDAPGQTDWSLLYPYCGWASDAMRYVEFKFEVPASFTASLQPLINLFDGIEAENHRIVFWFDN